MASKFSASSLLGLGAGLIGTYQQYDAGKSAEKKSRRNAKKIQVEAKEKRRRQSRANKQKQSQLRSRAAASGIKVGSGSTKTFLDDYIKEDEKQLSWLTDAANSEADLMKKNGKDAKKASQYGAYSSFFNTASNWWDK